MPMKFPNERWATASAYASARADVIRTMIFDTIGWECEECGERHGLEVNHVYRRDWEPRKLSKYRRALRYWRELREGVPLTPLCKSCNGAYRPLPGLPATPKLLTKGEPF